MSEWLHLWREGRFPATKACNNIDESNMQEEEDDDYCENDFDSENIDGEDHLKNVLLVIGPSGVCIKFFP